jgi:hypothetical protein
MTPSTPVTLGRYSYPSRDAATAHLRSMLRAPDGSPLPRYPTRLAPDDAAAVIDSLAYHPDSVSRRAIKPVAVEVRLNLPHSTPGLWLIGASGEAMPLSLKALFRSRGPSPREQLTRALRWEIEGQLRAARDSARGPSANRHIDHAPPLTLAVLVDRWMVSVGKVVGEIDTSPDPSSPSVRILTDRALAESWRDYHKTHARLRIVARETNAHPSTESTP